MKKQILIPVPSDILPSLNIYGTYRNMCDLSSFFIYEGERADDGWVSRCYLNGKVFVDEVIEREHENCGYFDADMKKAEADRYRAVEKMATTHEDWVEEGWGEESPLILGPRRKLDNVKYPIIYV